MAYFTKYTCIYHLDDKYILLLNTLTSAIDIVDNETMNKIKDMIGKKNKINDKDYPELFDKLKKRGYIFSSPIEENRIIDIFKYINKKSLSNVINTRFTICPTMGCNLRCTYCFEDDKQHTNFKLMSDGQLEVIFNHIRQCCLQLKEKEKLVLLKKGDKQSIKENLEPQISLFGGEPLMNFNYSIIKKILEFSCKIKIPVSITTNGTTMDDKYTKLLKTHKHIISAVQITMDGSKAIHDKRRVRADGHGTFDNICESIDKFLKIGIKIHLRINLDNENIYNILELKKVFQEKGWLKNPLFIAYASPVRCYKFDKKTESILTDSKMLDILMENKLYGFDDSFLTNVLSPVFGVVTRFFSTPGNKFKPWKKTYCEGTLGAQYCFSPDGTITTCLTCVGNQNYKIGTFDEKGIKIDKSRLSMWTRRDPFKINKCKNCKFVLFCGGGCPVESLENYEDINCPVCDDIERTLQIYIKHIKKYILKGIDEYTCTVKSRY